MIKKLLTIATIFSGIVANAQSFTATYDFAATTTVSGTTDPTTPPTATGLTFGSFSAVGTPSANPNASVRFSFVGWPAGATTGADTYSAMTGSISMNEYYEVTLTPASGYSVSLTSIDFGMRRSGSGVRNYAVRSSADSYATNLPASVGTNTNLSVVGSNEFFWNFDATSTSADQSGSSVSLSGTNFTDFTSPITFRFYGWNSEASGGTFSIDNVIINGSASNSTVTTSIKETETSSFAIYPNPNNGSFVVKSTTYPAIANIYDVTGKQVASKKMTETETSFNISQLENGIYFINMLTDTKSSTYKVIVNK